MNKNTGMIIGVIAIAVIALVIYSNGNSTDDSIVMEKKNDASTVVEQSSQKNIVKSDGTMVKPDGTMIKPDGTMVKPDGTMIKPDGTMVKPTVTSVAPKTGEAMMKVGSYEIYAPEKIAQASMTGNVVLFFRASWCPKCRALDADINANIKNIPGNLTILNVDYDNYAELKKKYGVTYQHTLVQVDKSGAMIKKWAGSPTLADFILEVK